jgi:phosphatidylinositol alpha-mannosyltransferase
VTFVQEIRCVRILHLDPDDVDNPLSGGGPRRTLEIYKRLSKRHEITVVTPTFPGSTPELVREGIRYIRLGGRVGNHGSSNHITFFFALPAAIRRLKHDLLVEDAMPPAAVTANPIFTRAPVVFSIQWFYSRTLAKQYHIPFHWAEALGMRLYDNFVVLTKTMERHVRKVRPEARIEVIGNGISDDLFTVPAAPGRTILYLGRIDLVDKGVGLLLQAYALMPPPRPKLVLAGFGWENDAVAELGSSLGVGDTVHNVGRVDEKGRRRLLEECRFVVFPSREETFGMVITEACAAGRPVVHFDLPPMNEVADHAGCISVPAFDVEGFSAAMRSLSYAPDQEIIARGNACRMRVLDQRWDAVAARQESFYLQVVGPTLGRSGRHELLTG